MTHGDGPDFVPATREISIGRGVLYRPVRSWHSGTYAGERLESVGGDRSGCIVGELGGGLKVTTPPRTVTHRVYWNASDPEDRISAFLSYPDGMSGVSEYHWEAMADDVERFVKEEELESWILDQIGDPS
jgi:hypothetical protein